MQKDNLQKGLATFRKSSCNTDKSYPYDISLMWHGRCYFSVIHIKNGKRNFRSDPRLIFEGVKSFGGYYSCRKYQGGANVPPLSPSSHIGEIQVIFEKSRSLKDKSKWDIIIHHENQSGKTFKEQHSLTHIKFTNFWNHRVASTSIVVAIISRCSSRFIRAIVFLGISWYL